MLLSTLGKFKFVMLNFTRRGMAGLINNFNWPVNHELNLMKTNKTKVSTTFRITMPCYTATLWFPLLLAFRLQEESRAYSGYTVC